MMALLSTCWCCCQLVDVVGGVGAGGGISVVVGVDDGGSH